MQDLICISHLRWGFVWQRPQHLLSRLGQQYRVLFVEEPTTNTNLHQPELRTFPGHTYNGSKITLACLHHPAAEERWIGHGDPETQATYERLLLDYLEKEEYHNPILWLYTPMAAPFVTAIPHQQLIYDVMDELSAFKGAPATLKEQEQAMLHRAEIVFTGGASLYRSKLPHNSNTHLFPSGVEIDHFVRAATESFARPDDLASIGSPVLGYFGVIDERMDLELLATMAKARPAWNIVLLGPVLKIDPADLPQAPNLHYLGMKQYNELPAYLAHFDVALVPFAMNEATRHLSPTKTLEYIAAHKPVVSTPIPDIVELYGDYVHIGQTTAEFIAHVETVLVEREQQRLTRHAREKQLLEEYSWENIASRMQAIIAENSLTPEEVDRLSNQALAAATWV